jgi:hypothetical protein
MAVTVAPEIHVPKSTGAVEFDSAPVVVENSADNTSTDAVKQPAVEEIRIDHLSQDVVVRTPTPGPVTVINFAFPRSSVEQVAAEKSAKEKKPAKPKTVKAVKMIKETKVVKAPAVPAPKTGKEAEVK